MKYKNQNYPYPVLSPFSDDYLEDNFNFNIEVKNNRDSLDISINFFVNSLYMNELINDEKAVFAVRIDCSRSRYRKFYTFNSKNNDIKIKSDKIDGLVKIKPFIVCDKKIKNYCSDSFHEDYENRSYEINKGSIIGVSNEMKFYPNKDKDPLKRVTSMFRFYLNTSQNAPAFDVIPSDDYIKIKLSESNHKILQKLKRSKGLQYILSAQFIVPTLINILYEVENKDKSEYENKRWYHVLKARMDSLGYNINDFGSHSIVKLAQEIINDPVSESMNVLNKELTRGEFSE